MPLKIVHQRAWPSLSLNALTIFVTPSAVMISASSANSPADHQEGPREK